MAAKWKPKPKVVLMKWISDLDPPAIKDTLSDWEQHFVASMSWQVAKGGTWSEKQELILERIYSEKTK